MLVVTRKSFQEASEVTKRRRISELSLLYTALYTAEELAKAFKKSFKKSFKKNGS